MHPGVPFTWPEAGTLGLTQDLFPTLSIGSKEASLYCESRYQ